MTMQLTHAHLQDAIDDLSDEFDTHAVIQRLTRIHPREYIEDLYEDRGAIDPFRTTHGKIGKMLTTMSTIRKRERVDSANVGGEESENQGWTKV